MKKRGGQRNVHLKGLVAGAIVVIGAAVAAWLLWPDVRRPLPTSTSTSTSLIKEVKPAKAAGIPAGDVPVVQEERAGVPDRKPFEGTVTTASYSRVVTLLDGTVTNLHPKATFTNRFDQVLSLAIKPGGIMMPLDLALRRFSEEQIWKMFHTDMKPEPGDSELVLERKLELQQLKIEVRELERQGYTLEQIFSEIEDIGRNTRAELRAARQGLAQLVKAGESPKTVNAWVREKNAVLKELGVPELRVPEGFVLPAAEGAVNQNEGTNE